MKSRRVFLGGIVGWVAGSGMGIWPADEAWGRERGLWVWEGRAFGTGVSIRFVPMGGEGDELAEACAGEIRRLEAMFTLYEEDSLLRRLNREGELRDPPVEFVELLVGAGEMHRVTGGAFDASVQPLWEFYEGHFREHPEEEPEGKALAKVRERVGWEKVEVRPERVVLGEDGMALTLNGIVQGYVTDRVTAILVEAGVEQALVNVGEYRAIGGRPDGEAWQVGIASPVERGEVIDVVALEDAALATSGGYGFQFDERGRFHHMIPPKGRAFQDVNRSVSVEAPEAMWADGLATAGSVMDWGSFRSVVEKLEGVRVRLYEGERLVGQGRSRDPRGRGLKK
ncbi:MAG: FAD:protein FMN transferase [Verrucomicrobiota bacterium]